MKPLHMTMLATLLAAGTVSSPALAQAASHGQSRATEWLDVPVGQSFIYQDTRTIARILVSDPQVAELKLLEQGQFQVRGLGVGSTDLWVWFRDDINNPVSYQLTVHEDLSNLIRRVDDIVEGAPPKVYPLKDRLVVEGAVPDVESLERVANVATIYDKEFVNLMSVSGDHQVQLEVVFAQVNRSGLRELGVNGLWDDGGYAASLEGPLSSAASAYAFRDGASALNGGILLGPSSGAFMLAGVLPGPYNLTAILGVLEQNSISKTLARPTLVALSGQQAEFLAGGEIPIPVASTGNRITIEFKEYGIKLVFVPTVLGGQVVDMRVYVESSEIDAATALRMTGVEIPGFVTRKSSSHLRVESGMTFAMAGMLNESMRASRAQIPILGDIPIVGALFRHVKHERTETELVIFVTPRLVRPMAPGEVPAPPGAHEDNNPNDFELFMLGLDHRAGSKSKNKNKNKDDTAAAELERTDALAANGAGPAGPVGLVR